MRNDFVTREHGNFSFHLLSSEKYVQTTIAVRMYLDLDEKVTTGAALLPYILLHGSERFRNNFIIQSKLDEEYGAKLGVSIDKKGDKQVLCLSLKFYNQKHKKIKPEILTVLHDLLTQPLITKKSVELEKELHSRRIQNEIFNAYNYSYKKSLLYLHDNGQKLYIDKVGSIEDIETWNESKLRNLHQKILHEAPIHLYVIGDIDEEGVFEQLSRCLWRGTAGSRHSMIPPKPVRSLIKTYHCEKFQSEHAIITACSSTGGITLKSEKYPALVVFNRLLGGLPHSRLFMNVRNQLQAAYSITSMLDAINGLLFIQTVIDPASEELVLRRIFKEVKSIKEGDCSQKEWRATIKILKNSYKLSLDSPISLIDFHQNGLISGKVRTMTEMIDCIDRVELQDIQDAAQVFQGYSIYTLGEG
ncbi:M16 family metallopeptidase [Peribacillus muralis]|uniref:M16 family metallopeptidase n=1 Tax=Peribacillus muralis TaxID=264697 RepID=UPI003D002290